MKKKMKRIINNFFGQIEIFKIILFSVPFISIVSCLGQESNKHHPIKYDKICISNIKLGDEVSMVWKYLGEPDSIVKFNSEVIPSDSSRYLYYSNSFVEVSDNKIISFSIKDSKLIGQHPEIQVGDNINDFLKKHSDLIYKDYIPSGVDYRVYSFKVEDENGLSNDELRILVLDNNIFEIYFWIPY
jgi:hypothetical protein